MKLWQTIMWKGAYWISAFTLMLSLICISQRLFIDSFLAFLLFLGFITFSYISHSGFIKEEDRMSKHFCPICKSNWDCECGDCGYDAILICKPCQKKKGLKHGEIKGNNQYL